MDTNTSLLLVNILINFMVILDHFIKRIKKSKCFFGEIEMRDDNNKKDDNKKDDDLEKNNVNIK